MSHYHKRSNVETTTNAMIKAKFGDSLRSKTDTAMVNEALCKILCHNLCRLVQSAYELGVTPTFWGKEITPDSQKSEDANLAEAYAGCERRRLSSGQFAVDHFAHQDRKIVPHEI